MRELILKNTGANNEFIIDESEPLEPYAGWTARTNTDGALKQPKQCSD